jgi:hypothetical protein
VDWQLRWDRGSWQAHDGAVLGVREADGAVVTHGRDGSVRGWARRAIVALQSDADALVPLFALPSLEASFCAAAVLARAGEVLVAAPAADASWGAALWALPRAAPVPDEPALVLVPGSEASTPLHALDAVGGAAGGGATDELAAHGGVAMALALLQAPCAEADAVLLLAALENGQVVARVAAQRVRRRAAAAIGDAVAPAAVSAPAETETVVPVGAPEGDASELVFARESVAGQGAPRASELHAALVGPPAAAPSPATDLDADGEVAWAWAGPLGRLQVAAVTLTALAATEGAERVALGSAGKAIALATLELRGTAGRSWTAHWRLVAEVALPHAGVAALAWTEGARGLVAAGWDRRVRLFGAAAQSLVPTAVLEWSSASIRCVAVSASGAAAPAGSRAALLALAATDDAPAPASTEGAGTVGVAAGAEDAFLLEALALRSLAGADDAALVVRGDGERAGERFGAALSGGVWVDGSSDSAGARATARLPSGTVVVGDADGALALVRV